MKIIQLLILMLAFKNSIGQITLLTTNSNLKMTVIRPINERIGKLTVYTVEFYIAAEVNRRLFGHVFLTHQQKKYPVTTFGNGDILKQKPLVFRQGDINRHFHSNAGNNNTLDKIADITGSILDIIFQEYTIEK